MYSQDEHYAIEHELAAKLKSAPRERRIELYTKVYDELFKKIPSHPQLHWHDGKSIRAEVKSKAKFISPFFGREKIFVEFGSGDGALSNAVADNFKKVFDIDCSNQFMTTTPGKANIKKIVQDCSDTLCFDEEIDIAFSANLIEHLHHDDAMIHLKNVHNALNDSGRYLIIAPNKCGWPNDISYNYDNFATCLHLNEQTSAELIDDLKSVGFRHVHLYLCASRKTIPTPAWFIKNLEKGILNLAPHVRKTIMKSLFLRPLNNMRLVACK